MNTDITLPVWLVVCQWTLLFALGFLIFVMYRQTALLAHLQDAGSEREGLSIGEKAPSFEHTPVNQGTSVPARFDPTGSWTLLVFADPGCVSCESTLRALERLAPKLGQTTHVLIVTDADPARIAAAEAFSRASLDISRVRSDVSYKLYRTNATPFAYLINPQGVIRAKSVVVDEASVRKLVQVVDRKPVNVEFIVS